MINSIPTIHLPYPSQDLLHGMSSKAAMRARDQSLALLRGQTNLLRVANDFHESYSQAKDKTLLHYRDYLISQAALAAMRSTLYTSFGSQELNTRAERVYGDRSFDSLWPLVARETLSADSVLYSGPPGSPAFYFLNADIEDDPYTSLNRLVELVWNLHGSTPSENPNDRLIGLKGYLGDLEGMARKLAAAVDSAYTQRDDSLAQRNLRQHFITPADLEKSSTELLYGSWDRQQMGLASALLNDRDRQDLATTMRFSDSIGLGGGFNSLLQNLVVEGYLEAARVLNEYQPQTQQTLSRFLEPDSGAADLKLQVASALDMVSTAYALQDMSSLFSDTATASSRVRNAALSWLGSSGAEELPTGNSMDLRPLATSLFGEESSLFTPLSVYDSVSAEGTPYAQIQGRMGSGINTFLQFPNSFRKDELPNEPGLTLARIVSDEELESETLSNDFSNIEAYAYHLGNQEQLTFEEYSALGSVSNVALVQSGLPAEDLNPFINGLVDVQTMNYEVLNTLQNAPRPRGLLGYEEMIRGMVSHLFRDAPSDEAINHVKIDGSREEHTSRVAGLLTQLKAVHLNSEIPTLSEWSTFIEDVI